MSTVEGWEGGIASDSSLPPVREESTETALLPATTPPPPHALLSPRACARGGARDPQRLTGYTPALGQRGEGGMMGAGLPRGQRYRGRGLRGSENGACRAILTALTI